MPDQKQPPKTCGSNGVTVPCREYINEVIRLRLEPIHVRLVNADKAVKVADETLKLRLESMNEFRAQMKDQIETFMPRSEIDGRMEKFAERSSVDRLWVVVVMMLGVGIAAMGAMAAAIFQLFQGAGP